MTPETFKEMLKKGYEELARASKIHDDAILAMARIRAMGDTMFASTGNQEYIDKVTGEL